ncbi:MAG: tRNA uridine-5-carboxymethylaminomethyl(34) synthesis GTPase MnmE [Eubacterium sp.]|nr:tRNA uridine-5-carboxymethylaminomethyl(34) synthesis GTPase MnmE [Eubacterium sp.]
MYKTDTICAVATGMGRSAIGIIRVSGPEAIQVCDGIFKGKKQIKDMESFTAAFGRIMDGDTILDEAVVLVMKAPHTYTTEDTVEIDLHGGMYVIKKVTELLLEKGVRPAEPGEFTKRAFLGGRIDMTEAEAVMDVINAESDMALSASVNQLTGLLRDEIRDLREKIIYNTAYIESAIDDPENYSLEGFDNELRDRVEEVIDRINVLLKTSDDGRIIKEGIRTAIVGRPNAGKSSILNLLLGENRAIVTDVEGTTRDTLEEYAEIDGIMLKLIDTAGIRDTDDTVEKIGVEKARSSIADADLVLFVVDGSEKINDNDREIMRLLGEKKVVLLINKSDKEKSLDDEEIIRIFQEEMPLNDKEIIAVPISAKTGEGLNELKEKIKRLFFSEQIDYNNQVYITNARNKESLMSARVSLEKVIESVDAGVGEDFYTIDLMSAYEALGEIIGEALEDDLADKIFKEFCMGK